MIIADNLLNEVKQALVFANTPAFLYNRIRRSSAANEIANNIKTEQILCLLTNISQKQDKETCDILNAYVLLCTLSNKLDYNLNEISAIDLTWLYWSDEILKIMAQNNETRCFITINIPISTKTEGQNYNNKEYSTNNESVTLSTIKEEVKKYEV